MGMTRQSKIKIKWTNDFAYIIGVIATDGNISPNLRHIHITSKDYEMIKNCKKILGIDNKIGKKSRDKEKEKKYFILQFGDVNFVNFLISIGITNNKSKTIAKIKIPKKYFLCFLGGCIDGDGSIVVFKHPESRKAQLTLKLFSASYKFLDWILFSCRKVCDIQGGSILDKYKNRVYTLRFGKQDSVKILTMIYSQNMLHLSRKKDIFIKYMGK
jgi:hypothetical protein